MEEACQVIGIDIGNSGLRIAELDLENQRIGKRQRMTWRHATSQSPSSTTQAIPAEHTKSVPESTLRTAEPRFAPDSKDWLVLIEQFLSASTFANATAPTKWLVSSVRRDALSVLQNFVNQRIAHGKKDAWHIVSRHHLSLRVDVLQPDRVGIDRLLAAAAAADLFHERPIIVMQVGSAMTVDVVTDPNTFEGGAILPGIPMMLRLLGQAADMLPEIEADDLTDVPPLPGRNTEQAMRCGTASALIGGAQHLVDRYRQLYGPETPVIMSGGDGNRLALHIPGPLHTIPELVLHGLMRARVEA